MSGGKSRINHVTIAIVFLLLAAGAFAAGRGTNFVINGSFEGEGGWSPVGEGFEIDRKVAHNGQLSLRCSSTNLQATSGAKQVITLAQPIQHPFRISAWSRAENADVAQDYDLYLDLFYEDGTPLWGQIAHFQPGTHDWQKAELDFEVTKPVKRIEVHVLFRKAQGTVWFDDIEVILQPFSFTQMRVLPELFGTGSLAVMGNCSLPAKWKAMLEGPNGLRREASGDRAPIRAEWSDISLGSTGAPGALNCRLSITATDGLLGETIVTEQTVQLGTKGKQTPYLLWTESSMQRVMPQALPSEIPAKTSWQLSVAGGEYESFQVVLRPAPGQTLQHVAVEASDLVSRENQQRISSKNMEWHQVGYVKVDQPMKHPAVNDAGGGWWPDPLLPVENFEVAACFAQPIWVTVYAPPGTPAGNYTGSLTIRPQGVEPTSVPVSVEVFDFTLPREGHLKTAFALMDGFLERVYGKPLTPALRQRFGHFVLQHRLNPDDISRTSPPDLDDMNHYRAQGLNAFNVLNMVEERGSHAWRCYSDLPVYTPQFKQRLMERLDPYVEKLRREGLANKAYIYTFDERGPEFFPIIREYFGLVKQRYPEIRTLTTAYVPQDPKIMRDLNVDWNCPVSSVYRLADAERCRAAGLQVWTYICCGPRYPYANWMADDPLIEARVIWWQAYQQKVDGFLYWGLNIWDHVSNTKPIDPARGAFLDWSIRSGDDQLRLYGDGRLLYPGKTGPIGSIRLANIRDGLEDYEYLWFLSQKANDHEIARQACQPVTSDLTQFTRDPSVLYRQREAIARKIASK